MRDKQNLEVIALLSILVILNLNDPPPPFVILNEWIPGQHSKKPKLPRATLNMTFILFVSGHFDVHRLKLKLLSA